MVGLSSISGTHPDDHADVALESLDNIGARKTAAMLRKAIDIAFGGNVPVSQADRQEQLKVNENSNMEELGKLDSEFYRYPEDFYRMLNQYMAN